VIAGVRVFAPAKVNLYLGVGRRRDDGYHDVTTILQAVDLCDELELVPTQGLSISCAPELGIPAEENLAFKAASRLAGELGRPADAAISLRKRIPAGAGLGGGSSDAAGVLTGLAALWGLPERDPVLTRVATSLGADVAFFLGVGAGTALYSGRGDRLVRSLPTPTLDLVLLKPAGSIPTSAAYAAFDAAPAAPGDITCLLRAVERCDAETVAASLSNNMEDVACTLEPAVGDALAWVRAAPGVLGVAVAGSGSAIFGVCVDARAAREIAAAAEGQGMWSAVTTTRDRAVVAERMCE